MPQTVRKYWGKHRGRVALNFNWAAIEHDSVVLISASEYNERGARFVGAASIRVSNIAPHGPPFDANRGVTFVVNIGGRSRIDLVTDITVLDAKPVEVQHYSPPTPRNIGLRMQYQQSGQWCWIAVATSINRYYNPLSSWWQCRVMTEIGRAINGFPETSSGCPSLNMIAMNPPLLNALSNPYAITARGIMDIPAYGVDARYLKSGGVTDALKTTDNYQSYEGPDFPLSKIEAELAAGRPVIADITWYSGGSHSVAIAGVLDDSLLILDPWDGEAVVRYQNFPAGYYGGAKLDGFALTKA